jgi:glucans biosynthesis protein
MKTTSCNEHKHYAFENAPRCGAKTKRNNGSPCRSPAVRGKNRCRIHGGAKGSGARCGNQNARKHGYSTNAAKAQNREVRMLIRQWKMFQDEYD